MGFKLSENSRGEKTIEMDFEEVKEIIADEFEPCEIFSEDKIREYVESKFDPNDIFTEERLTEWAEHNGWVKVG